MRTGIRIQPLLCTAFVLIAAACSSSVTKSPSFAVSADSVQTALNKLVDCERMNVKGKEIKANGEQRTELQVDIINGKNVPADDAAKSALAKDIAMLMKHSLQDPQEYKSFKIIFMSVKEKNGVTQKSWEGKVFATEEL